MLSDDPTATPSPGGEAEFPGAGEGRSAAALEPGAAAGSAPRPDDDLVSRLEIVESQPLADRAAAYEAIHEDLARRLENNMTVPGR